MTYKLKRAVHIILLILLILLGFYVFGYYLFAQEIDQLRSLPTTFLIVVVAYILFQFINRFFYKKTPWYNWLFYVGLVAIIIPLPLFSLQSGWIFYVTRIGTLFLVLPPFIGLIGVLRVKQTDM